MRHFLIFCVDVGFVCVCLQKLFEMSFSASTPMFPNHSEGEANELVRNLRCYYSCILGRVFYLKSEF